MLSDNNRDHELSEFVISFQLKKYLSIALHLLLSFLAARGLKGIFQSYWFWNINCFFKDELGKVEYGYSNINSAKKESRDHYGNVAGAYSYVDSTGIPKTVSYIADAYGFRLTGANNLPAPTADTPEVAYARQAHFDALAHAGH